MVGRSGTGKTTCAMLRLYGIEIVEKMEEISRRSREEVKEGL
jgi:ABC-type dipeptide/oligopeptide/nickel transport system ATPase subunit